MGLGELIAMFKFADMITQGLNVSSLRQKILSNNLANANTPNFRRSDVDFAAVFAQVNSIPVEITHKNHINIKGNNNQSHIKQDKSNLMRNDGNNVDVDREMMFLLENQLHYQAMADVVSRNLSMLRSVIGEGRR